MVGNSLVLTHPTVLGVHWRSFQGTELPLPTVPPLGPEPLSLVHRVYRLSRQEEAGPLGSVS